MVVDLPAPLGPIRQFALRDAEADRLQRLDLAPAAMEQAFDSAHRPCVALGDAIGLRQLLDEDLGHAWAPGLMKGRGT